MSEEDTYPDVPDWEDEYLDRISDRLMHNYDLKKDEAVAGEQFVLYGEMNLESKKHFLHPSVEYANHSADEYLFVRQVDDVSVADLERWVEFGHDLADEWIEADEDHYSTDFTFALVVPELTDEVRDFVVGFSDRNLMKYGYYGHYEVNLLVVAPDEEELVASSSADVADAFALWERIERKKTGLLGLIARRFQV